MRSLILLQAGSAMGGGFDLDIDRVFRMGTTFMFIVLAGVGVYYTMKAVWPSDKW